jgi:hypothetical protein
MITSPRQHSNGTHRETGKLADQSKHEGANERTPENQHYMDRGKAHRTEQDPMADFHKGSMLRVGVKGTYI